MIALKRLIYLYLGLLISSPLLFSQDYKSVIFNHINTTNGLSQQSVLSLYQDEFGSIWLGTFCGIDRYDGRTFWNISCQQQNQFKVHGDEILAITGDKNGHVYALNENGISIISLNDSATINIWNSNIGCISMGKTHLWIAIKNQIYYLDNKNKIIKYNLQPNINEPILSIKEHSNGALWIGSSKSCVVILSNKKVKSLMSAHISSFFETKQGYMWVGTANNGAFLYNMQCENIYVLNKKNGLSNNFVRSFAEDKYNRIWIGTFWGLNCFNPTNNTVNVFLNSPYDPFTLSHNSVYSLLEDRQQTIWIGTYYGGVNYVNMQGHNFKYLSLLNPIRTNVNQVIVGRIVEDRIGNIWISTDGSGLMEIEKKSGKVIEYLEKFGDKEFFNNIKAILVDKENNLWLAIHQQGLYYYNKKKFEQFPILINGISGSYNASIITDIIQYNNKILVSTYDGILIFDPKTHIYDFFLPPTIQSRIGKKANTIYIDTKGYLWIGTKGEGLYKYDLRTKIVSKYKKTDINNSTQISNNYITEITEDKNGDLWIATYGGGVNHYNHNDDIFTHLTESNIGLSNNYIQSVKSINDSLLLIGTKSSIVAFNPLSNKIITEITSSTGLPLQELLERTMCVTKENQLLLGGKSGLVNFQTLHFYTTQADIPLYFSELKINNHKIIPNDRNHILTKPLRDTKKIVLSYSQNVFSLNFATSNFINQMQENYEYTLEGADENWTKVIGNNSISFTNINSGNYLLKLRSIRDKSDEISIRIVILSPWYLSWWAIIFYVGILALILFFFFSNKKKKMQLKIKENEKLQLETLNQQKLNFFTYVSHEFKTPLTLISGQINSILQYEKMPSAILKRMLNLQNNTFRLQRLISELLDFRKQDEGHLKLTIYKIDLNYYLREIFATFNEFAQHKEINYQFIDFGISYTEVWIDPEQMEKVFFNLLSNAFKFTPSKGAISLTIYNEPDKIRVSIKDNGKGIPLSEIGKVFDMFYQTDNQLNTLVGTSGTGIGLSLAKSIVEYHNGRISVESIEGKGSQFNVDLQLGCSHFPENIISHDTWIRVGENSEYISKNSDFVTANVNNNIANKSIDITGDKPTILIVEDNTELLNFIASLFQDICFIITASDGIGGLEIAQKKLPDLVLSDVMMPKMSGTEMCVKLKTMIDTSHIPIVLLTAKSANQFIINGLQNGADDYITKPFDNKLLVIRCLNLINTRRLLQKKYQSSKSPLNPIELATNQLDIEFITKIENIISENINNTSFDVSFLAQEMCMSKSSFYNKIKALSGITPLDMINNYRLKKAIEYLNTVPKISILDLSLLVGFNSSKYFAKCFKAFYGYTPSDYLKKQKR